jgi:threonine dehydratase
MAASVGTPDIEAAWKRIEPYVRTTPVVRLNRGLLHPDAEIFLKLELMQVTGSFKPRGAFNRILSNTVPAAGIIAASGGNHGLATAYAVRTLGYRAEIFVPTISSPVKQQRLRDYGAALYVTGANYKEALLASTERARETGALVTHAYNQKETIAGQGTCGREFNLQVPDLDTVLVATGGGGFIAGIAAWFKGEVKVVSVEPEQCCCLWMAFQKGAPVAVPVAGIAADSLGSTEVGELAWEICRNLVSAAVLVKDDSIRDAQRWLWRELRVIAEPGGATALAALLSGAYVPASSERVGVVVCGGNADLQSDVFQV